jgi:signal transduction histidine kinase
MKLNINITAKIILLNIILISMILICMGYFFIQYEKKHSRRAIEEKANALLQNLAYNSEYGILTKNTIELNMLLTAIIKDKDIAYARVENADKKVIVSQKSNRKVSYIEEIYAPVMSTQMYSLPEDALLDSAMNTLDNKGLCIGFVRIGISLDRFNKEIRHMYNVIISSIFLIAFIGNMFILLGLKFLIVNPLKELMSGIQKIGEGNWSYRINVKRNDEIGKVAHVFNSMAQKLGDSVTELQQFAYVASHDLQEPLRMVTSYVELIKKRYTDKLDEAGNDFIFFAVDGAKRMQQLIHDLLDYSRTTRNTDAYILVPIQNILNIVYSNLKILIEETQTEIIYNNNVSIWCNKNQMVQLFQNFISNAIKFRKKDIPCKIRISVKNTYDGYEFAIEDNGIGIPVNMREKVFVIFQRLHTREQYEGTGIGLAICKKIVERHGGNIWIETAPNGGCIFKFTIKTNNDNMH